MRRPRLRLTVTGLMVLVGSVAAFFGGVTYGMKLGRLSEEYRKRAVRHIAEERQAAADVARHAKSSKELRRSIAERRARGEVTFEDAREGLAYLAEWDRRAAEALAYWTRLRVGYERAADSPWMPLSSDLAGPEELALRFAQSAGAKDDRAATAIYRAALMAETNDPGYLARGPKVAAFGGGLSWRVFFTDPSTGATQKMNSDFSEGTVAEYLARR